MNDLISFKESSTGNNGIANGGPRGSKGGPVTPDGFSSLSFVKPAAVQLSLSEQLKARSQQASQSPNSNSQVALADSLFWDNVDKRKGATPNDNDIFGLAETAPAEGHSGSSEARSQTIEDDLLGPLGAPVNSRTPEPLASAPSRQQHRTSVPIDQSSQDKKVIELVDMGFPVTEAKVALESTGGNTEAAISWLLDEAHRRSKTQAQSTRDPSTSVKQQSQDGRTRVDGGRRESPASIARLPITAVEVSAKATQVGAIFLKQANTLWSTGRKQVQKAVKDFQQDDEMTVPKWMKETKSASTERPSRRAGRSTSPAPDSRGRQVKQGDRADRNGALTDEAAMLDMPVSKPESRATSSLHSSIRRDEVESQPPREPVGRKQNNRPLQSQEIPNRPISASITPRWMQQPSGQAISSPRSQLSRQAVEEESGKAYVSPARRRKAPADKPTTTSLPLKPASRMNEDLLGISNPQSRTLSPPDRTSSAPPLHAPFTQPFSEPPRQSTVRQPLRKAAPPRTIPPASQEALAASSRHRVSGSDAFKRGDYVSAHISYSSALAALPCGHPLIIVILSNRSLTSLKNGNPKAALSDADEALVIIGPLQGEGETIDLDGTVKDMRNFWGKALARKAEALEQLEQYTEAGQIWQQAVEAGVGGGVAAQGRQRCERATAEKKSSTAVSTAAKRKPPAPRPAPVGPGSTEALARLRASNVAQSEDEDLKFALTDHVAQKIQSWSAGKEINLRALLSSLDAVLWPDSGWKKVGLNELLVPQRVKVVYMKAVAKVHPDKIGRDSGVETRMVAESVFAVLCKAWEAFRVENGL